MKDSKDATSAKFQSTGSLEDIPTIIIDDDDDDDYGEISKPYKNICAADEIICLDNDDDDGDGEDAMKIVVPVSVAMKEIPPENIATDKIVVNEETPCASKVEMPKDAVTLIKIAEGIFEKKESELSALIGEAEEYFQVLTQNEEEEKVEGAKQSKEILAEQSGSINGDETVQTNEEAEHMQENLGNIVESVEGEVETAQATEDASLNSQKLDEDIMMNVVESEEKTNLKVSTYKIDEEIGKSQEQDNPEEPAIENNKILQGLKELSMKIVVVSNEDCKSYEKSMRNDKDGTPFHPNEIICIDDVEMEDEQAINTAEKDTEMAENYDLKELQSDNPDNVCDGNADSSDSGGNNLLRKAQTPRYSPYEIHSEADDEDSEYLISIVDDFSSVKSLDNDDEIQSGPPPTKRFRFYAAGGNKNSNELISIPSNKPIPLYPPPKLEENTTPVSLEFLSRFKKSFDQMTKNDLEELVLQKIVEALVHESEFAELRVIIEKQEKIIARHRTQIVQLGKKYHELEKMFASAVKTFFQH